MNPRLKVLLLARLVPERGQLDTIGIPEAARRRGHRVDVASTDNINPRLLAADRHDVVICRFSGDPRADNAVSMLSDLNVPVVGAGNGRWSGDDQIMTLGALRQAGIPTPSYLVLASPCDAEAAVSKLGSPVVTKDPRTMGGAGVRLAVDTDDVRRHLRLMPEGSQLIVQRFYAESAGEDLRLFVVADEVVASIRRRARPGEFRANLLLGGAAVASWATRTEREMAVAATRAVGLDIAGVDMLRTAGGPVVVEVNHNPGATGIAGAAEAIVRYAEYRAGPHRPAQMGG